MKAARAAMAVAGGASGQCAFCEAEQRRASTGSGSVRVSVTVAHALPRGARLASPAGDARADPRCDTLAMLVAVRVALRLGAVEIAPSVLACADTRARADAVR